MVCAEARCPEVARELGDRGAELLIVPMASGDVILPQPEEGAKADGEEFRDVLLPAVREMGVPAIGLGASGTFSFHHDDQEHVHRYRGGCMVVSEHGHVQYWRPSDGPELHRFNLRLPEGTLT
jgi:predicted amidohydrolase